MKKKIDHRHFICAAVPILLSVWYFFRSFNSLIRLWESLKDLGSCFVYALFYDEPWCPFPSVTLPSTVDVRTVIPDNLQAFIDRSDEFFDLFFDLENFLYYLVWILPFVELVVQLMLIGSMTWFCFFVLKRYVLKPSKNTDYDRQSSPLKLYLKYERFFEAPILKYMLRLKKFFMQRKYYTYTTVAIFLVGSNLASVLFAVFAYYFYFVGSLDFTSVFFQIYKLSVDLLIALRSLPFIAWILISWYTFNFLCVYHAYKRLERQENANEAFVRDLSMVVFVTGLMRSGKTRLISSLQKSKSKVYRDDSLDIMLEIHSHFPHFPWKAYYRKIFELVLAGKIKGLGYCERFVAALKKRFDASMSSEDLFGYDYKYYGMYYDNGNVVIDLFQDLVDFAQAFLIYSEPTYFFGTYSMREDHKLIYEGNFPSWDMDIFRRPSFDGNGSYSHVLDFDAIRPGKKFNPKSKVYGSIEYGIGGIPEIDKERENTLELKETKKKSEECNQLNDLMNQHLKMQGHGAMVHYKCFISLFTDSQRASSWGADGRELSEHVRIEETSELKLARHFFTIRSWLGDKLRDFQKSETFKYWVNRGDLTLRAYLLEKFVCRYLEYVDFQTNTFGYRVQVLSREASDGEGPRSMHRFYQANKKIYSGLYDTASYSSYFRKYNKISGIAFRDIPRYKKLTPDLDELAKYSHSHFMKKLLKDQYSEKGDDDDDFK